MIPEFFTCTVPHSIFFFILDENCLGTKHRAKKREKREPYHTKIRTQKGKHNICQK